ncbi:MAG: hypothetical protein ACKV0T_07555 [Planctomycetales bacterium]
MSELAHSQPLSEVHPIAGAVLSTPEFDRKEISAFGQDDGKAISVIGKMLVLFFFYSLLAMGVVAWLTIQGVGKEYPAAAHADHAAGTEEF